MSATSDPRRQGTGGAGSEYSYRRSLSVRELLPAIGIGIGAGLAAFYVARVLLQRTPLLPERQAAPRPLRAPRSRSAATLVGRG